MTISRRGFIAGLALTGAAAPAAWYAQREVRRAYKALDPQDPETPGEATAGPADQATQRLADKLRGVWHIRFEGRDAGLSGAPREMQMLLDIAPRGRGVRGFIDTAENLRSKAAPRFRVIGDLQASAGPTLYLRIMNGQAGDEPHSDAPDYELSMLLDEVWGAFGNAGSGSLSGRVQRLDRPLMLPELDNNFIAVKQVFPEARERIAMSPPFLAWLISHEHRLFHQLWHASRDKWHKLPDDKRDALRGIGWQPGPRDRERDARGPRKDRNGSGVDFLFMHRHMLIQARSIQPLPSWPRFPLPQPELERDRLGFIRYFDNQDGCSLPPNWLAPGDDEYTQLVSDIKSTETWHTHFEVWESRYRDPRYLSTLTLGQFGSQLELELHDWLHMRWASVARDPANGQPVPMARRSDDFAERWFGPENDFLADPFSSHVNPVFWMFHGWIDDRIDDWFRAHERFHPGEVTRLELNGVPWYGSARWVDINDPWLGPETHGCSTTPGLNAGTTMEMDPEVMKLALRITFAAEDKLGDLLRRVPRRPWYARNILSAMA
jgi:hypothetical protein